MYIAGLEDAQYKQEKISFWDDVYGFNMRAIKEVALVEPLVDTVDDRCVVTDAYPIKEIDITTVTKEELTFSSPFVLRSRSKDYIQAFVSYFDIEFSCCHKPVFFSTGPHAQYTHWKQTVFYLKEDLTVDQDEEIRGHIDVKPHPQNHRNLVIDIQHEFNGKLSQSKGSTSYQMC
jgi:protein arginine N-methyltransferase 1